MAPDSPSVWLTTLGCAKNQVDSEKISGVLAEAGYQQAMAAADADVVMVNTCAFIEAARRESVDTVLELAAAKRSDARVVVLGCMAQRYEDELASVLPEADAVIGIARYGELVGRLDELTEWEPVRLAASPLDILDDVRRPAPLAPFAYVKIAEGCDKACSFCAIPQFRGPQRSRSPVAIRSEIEALAAQGAGEIVLVAQDLAAYGRDLDAPGGVVELLRFVSDVDGLRRLRLLYLYPKEVTDALVAEIAANPIVAAYFDLSLQHSSGRLLRGMKRPGDGASHLRLIDRIRAAVPDAALRSAFIVGFPGETDADVDDLCDFLEEARLDWAAFFPYSAEEGTAALELPGIVDTDVVAQRMRRLQETQGRISADRNAEQVGRSFEVVVDTVEAGTPVARSYREAPEIDGVVLLDRGAQGQWLTARITGAYEQELAGKVIS